jgi:hypothetical protein
MLPDALAEIVPLLSTLLTGAVPVPPSALIPLLEPEMVPVLLDTVRFVVARMPELPVPVPDILPELDETVSFTIACIPFFSPVIKPVVEPLPELETVIAAP